MTCNFHNGTFLSAFLLLSCVICTSVFSLPVCAKSILKNEGHSFSSKYKTLFNNEYFQQSDAYFFLELKRIIISNFWYILWSACWTVVVFSNVTIFYNENIIITNCITSIHYWLSFLNKIWVFCVFYLIF